MNPQICPDCLARNVIAPLHGPTCPHGRPKAEWWPAGWHAMPERDRLAWLRATAIRQPAIPAGSKPTRG